MRSLLSESHICYNHVQRKRADLHLLLQLADCPAMPVSLINCKKLKALDIF